MIIARKDIEEGSYFPIRAGILIFYGKVITLNSNFKLDRWYLDIKLPCWIYQPYRDFLTNREYIGWRRFHLGFAINFIGEWTKIDQITWFWSTRNYEQQPAAIEIFYRKK